MRFLMMGKSLRIATLAVAMVFSACDSNSSPEENLEEMTRKVAGKFEDVKMISTRELAAWLGDSARQPPQLLDIREPEEYAVSHLPGAIRCDPDASAEQILAKIDPERAVVVYCSVGYRSSALAERLGSSVPQALNLEGSIFKWANEGRPLVKDNQPTTRVHPYNKKFGKMLRKSLHAY
ncbi:rhodanese-like domain-containing protein [Luteolibacter algae]|uniref:Rhodanese-like domain-containing protein n=1 Tax=Luteolibacter algae TaxID=454151 RepID=A0ABW5D3X6_9BACT